MIKTSRNPSTIGIPRRTGKRARATRAINDIENGHDLERSPKSRDVLPGPGVSNKNGQGDRDSPIGAMEKGDEKTGGEDAKERPRKKVRVKSPTGSSQREEMEEGAQERARRTRRKEKQSKSWSGENGRWLRRGSRDRKSPERYGF